MDRTQIATELHDGGFNCAQSVFVSFCESYGIPKETGLKIAGGLGGGVRSGEICGAVSGAVLVIGLKYGQTVPGDLQAKEFCGAETVKFISAFRERNKAITCRELLGIDTSVGNNREIAKNRGLLAICPSLINSAVEILQEMGY